MKVKLITTMAGPLGTYMAGRELDRELSEDTKQALVAGGYAEKMSEPQITQITVPPGLDQERIETTSLPVAKAETAVVRHRGRRKA